MEKKIPIYRIVRRYFRNSTTKAIEVEYFIQYLKTNFIFMDEWKDCIEKSYHPEFGGYESSLRFSSIGEAIKVLSNLRKEIPEESIVYSP